jgi:hypothetical protein
MSNRIQEKEIDIDDSHLLDMTNEFVRLSMRNSMGHQQQMMNNLNNNNGRTFNIKMDDGSAQ